MIWVQRANALSRVTPLVGEEEVLMAMVTEKHMRISSRTIICLFKFASSPLNVGLVSQSYNILVVVGMLIIRLIYLYQNTSLI